MLSNAGANMQPQYVYNNYKDAGNANDALELTIDASLGRESSHIHPSASNLFTVHPRTLSAGRGVATIVRQRERPPRIFGIPDRYWSKSLVCVKGRAMPILPQLLYALYTVAVVVGVIQWLEHLHTTDGTPDKFYKEAMERFKALQYPITTIGTALFLLLAFRTNSCYDRWWEGRKLWDASTSKVCDLARMLTAYVAPVNKEAARKLLEYSLVVVYASKWTLRQHKEAKDMEDMKNRGLLTPEERSELAASPAPVQVAAQKMSTILQPFFGSKSSPDLPAVLLGQLDNNIRGLLTDAMACVRIMTTPMPFAYIVHLRSFMVLWLMGFPWALIPTLGYHAIYIAAIVGYGLFGFEET